MSKRTIGRTPPVAEGGRTIDLEDSAASASAEEDDRELLLLALLEQLYSDRAAGSYLDLSSYCAANPELSDAFLNLALAAEWEEYEEIAEIGGAPGGDTSESLPLSPGVRRALASIPEFSQIPADSTIASSGSLQRRRVAENRPNYRACRPGKRSDV